jgi:predicted RNase H-like HicB family nuclease
MATKSYTAIVEREGSGYVALCPELNVASQGETSNPPQPTSKKL